MLGLVPTFLSMVFIVAVEAKSTDSSRPFCFFSRPMALGSGVMSGLDGKSPALILAEKYQNSSALIQEAYPGYAGSVILQYPSFREQLKNVSAVIALDLFYWDQVACGEPGWDEKNRKAINTLFQSTVEKNIPLVIGNIAKQSVFPRAKVQQPCADQINRRIQERCNARPEKCLIIDLEALSRKIEKKFNDSLSNLNVREANQLIREQITRDGIHPRNRSAAIMAESLDALMRESRLVCR